MKRIGSVILTVTFMFAMLVSTKGYAHEKKDMKLTKNAQSALLMEADTGKIIYNKNAKEKLPPASMTKIMTMLLVMEALKNGKISMDQKVRTSEYAASMGGSQIFLEEGETMTVDELLRGIAIGSANDASVALAEEIDGTEPAFVEHMNKKAKQMGLKHTHFENATGLPEKNHYSSAHDMAKMAQALLTYEKITNYTGKYEDYLREGTDDKFWLVNTNRLVKFYPAVDGLKTGYTNEAKYCLTATAKKDDMRIIAVIMGAPTTKKRNQQITKMIDYAYSKYQLHNVYKEHATVKKINISKGTKKQLPVVTSRKSALLTKKGETPKNIKKSINISSNLKAPLKKGDKIGTLQLKTDGKTRSQIPLLAGADIDKASWWHLFKRSLGDFNLASNGD